MSPSRKRLPLNALRAFEAVAQEGSFTAGAEALSVTQSAVSRHVTALEAQLGRTLFFRTGNSIRPTAAGQRLLPALTRAFDQIAEAMDAASAGDALRLHVAPGFLQAVPQPFIRDLRTANPGVAIMVKSANNVGLADPGADVAVVFDQVRDATPPYTRLLWRIRLTPVCNSRDAERLRSAGLPALLQSEQLLHVRIPGHSEDMLWAEFATQQGVKDLSPGGLALDTLAMALEFARSGAGVALADTRVLRRQAGAGDLCAPFEADTESRFGYYLTVSPDAQAREDARILYAHIAQLAASSAEAVN